MTQIIKGIGTLHTPIFAIHGKERKELIKKRNRLRSFVKNFRYGVEVNNDMYSFYGEHNKIINKEEQDEIAKKAQIELDEMNNQLMEPYHG